MEPLTIILAALAAGAAEAAVKSTASDAVKAGYQALKAAIKRRFGVNAEGEFILSKYESQPQVWEKPLSEELTKVRAHEDHDVVKLAQEILALIDPRGTDAGNYSVNYGTIGQLVQIDHAEHLALRDQTISYTTIERQTAAEWVKNGLQYLELQMYSEAVDAFERAILAGPPNAKALYCLALARIGGKMPRFLRPSTMTAVEGNLHAAVALDGTQAHYFYLWALVKDDYYSYNHIIAPPPPVREIISRARQAALARQDIDLMLKHVSISDVTARALLNSL